MVEPPPDVFRTAEVVRAGDNDRALRRSFERGTLVRLHRGIYVDAEGWQELGDVEQYRLRAVACAPLLPPTAVYSHRAAAVLLGLPLLGEMPPLLDAIDPRARQTRTGSSIRIRAARLADDDVVEVDGVRVTSPARTAVDLGALLPFLDAVMVLDAGLPSSERRRRRDGRLPRPGLFTQADLDAVLDRRGPLRAHRRLARARAFADGDADSPFESLSRVRCLERDVPAPCLQQSFRDDGGWIGEVDFTWAEFGVMGEADGRIKYTDSTLLAGRSPADVVVEEKMREDRLRAVPGFRGFARWSWADAWQADPMLGVLSRAGVRWHGPA